MNLTLFDKILGGGLLAGKKTYLAAGALLFGGAIQWLSGEATLVEFITVGAEALGLAGLRAGFAKGATVNSRGLVAASLLTLAVVLSACETRQEYAGITEIVVTVPGNSSFPEVTYLSGKEAGTLDAQYERDGDGTTVTIGASGLSAFRGQEVQAEYLKARAAGAFDTLKEVAPGLFTAICNAVGLATGGAGAAAC